EDHGHHHGLTIHFIINDVLMALFFAIAAKEVWEAMLPGGALSDIRKAATPLIGTAGGVIGPALVYVGGALLMGQLRSLGSGWAIPCATDIAFSYLVAKLIFGNGHPAISFLLLLAIADDAVGLAILAVFYPSAETNFAWLGLTAVAVAIGFGLRRARVTNFWWYLLVPGVLSWVSFYMAGVHAALGLVPIIPTLPHAKMDMGIFAGDGKQTDTLNQFEHWWKNPVELILGLFALMNAGVVFSAFGAGTWLVMAGLFLGKPLGIGLFTYAAMRWLRFELPGGMNMKHVIVLGCIASLGFTVALFVSTAAFPNPGAIQDSVKMGSLLSFLAPVFAFGSAMLLGIRPVVFGPLRERQTVSAKSPQGAS
ncbi:MAG: Na+/H+ antiporter NhaA, partial [Planctomycetota bacterium]